MRLTEKRVVNIVEYLVRHLLHQGEPLGDGKRIIGQLVAQGYQLSEIQEAFAWIFREKDIIDIEQSKDRIYQGIRVFSSKEEMRFSQCFREELLRLLSSGLISQGEMEAIILAGVRLDRPEIDLKDLAPLLKGSVSEPERLALILTRAGSEPPQLLH